MGTLGIALQGWPVPCLCVCAVVCLVLGLSSRLTSGPFDLKGKIINNKKWVFVRMGGGWDWWIFLEEECPPYKGTHQVKG